MAIIGLEGMRIFARHGFYPEEQILGTEFILDVFLETDIDEAAMEDNLFKTINYETVYQLCLIEMRTPSKLIEEVCQRIVHRLFEYFDFISGIKVKMRKMHPPLGGRIDCASIQIAFGSLG
ncbi:MAG: dihydroneopterin aldolase [Saprospiraceae bacterium]|nr:dihydroneopterin aldolase [Saprospiraceae bacterium]